MFNLQLFKPKGQAIKDKILKNSEAMLGVMAESVQGSRQCPVMGGTKCIGQFCEHMMELQSFNNETGTTTKFWRCAYTQTPLLLIEQAQILRNILNELLLKKEKGNV